MAEKIIINTIFCAPKLPTVESFSKLFASGNAEKPKELVEGYCLKLGELKKQERLQGLRALAAVVELACSESVTAVLPANEGCLPELDFLLFCGSEEETVNYIYNSIETAVRKITEIGSGSKSNVVELIKAYIRKKYGSPILMKELASAVGLSPNYLGKLFKEYTGETIAEYIHRFRITKACDLITETNAKISQIAVDVGYNDANYFSCIFKQHIGISPREYREKGFRSCDIGCP